MGNLDLLGVFRHFPLCFATFALRYAPNTSSIIRSSFTGLISRNLLQEFLQDFLEVLFLELLQEFVVEFLQKFFRMLQMLQGPTTILSEFFKFYWSFLKIS